MLDSVSSFRSFSAFGVTRPALLPRRGLIPVGKPSRIRWLDLRSFQKRLEDEGVSDRLPDLEDHIKELAECNRRVFGFGFEPDAIRVPDRDLPLMVLGLREGILTRPVVIDSPKTDDAVRLGLDLACPMLRYRYECLVRSGIPFAGATPGWALVSELRGPRHGSLADRIRGAGSSVAVDDLWSLHEQLPPAATIGERLGAGPRLVLAGSNWEPCHNRVLATGGDGAPVVRTLSCIRSAAHALEQGCRFLTPEAALLLLGTPRVRERVSTFLATESSIWLSAVNPHGRVAMLRSLPDGVLLSCEDPRRIEPFDRVPASSE